MGDVVGEPGVFVVEGAGDWTGRSVNTVLGAKLLERERKAGMERGGVTDSDS